MIVVYHADPDGFCAAWLASLAFPNDHELIPLSISNKHKTEFNFTGKDVILADISFPWETTIEFRKSANSLIVIDHHKTALRELSNFPSCIIDLTKSSARLMYEYLKKLQPKSKALEVTEWVVDYVNDRELWKHELLNTRAINAAIQSLPFAPEHWTSFACDGMTAATTIGLPILRYINLNIEKHLNHCSPMRLIGYNAKTCNCTAVKIWSDLLHTMLISDNSIDIAVAWCDTTDNRRIYSLRSRKNGPDVEEIARSFGGGGHEHAAGFSVKAKSDPSLPFKTEGIELL